MSKRTARSELLAFFTILRYYFSIKIENMKSKEKSKKLVVVADDYGFCKSVNEGIEKALEEGFLTEISLMVNAKASESAIETIKKKGIENVGIHVDFSKDKVMHETDYVKLFKEKSYEDVSKMFQDEIEIFEKGIGKAPSHITAHKGIHGNFKLLYELIDYAKQKDIPVRRPHVDLSGVTLEEGNYAAEIMIKRAGLRTTQHLFMHVRGVDPELIKEDFLKDLKKVKSGESAEFLFHPGFFDRELLENSSLNFERTRDLALLLDKSFKKDIENLGFKFVSYNQI